MTTVSSSIQVREYTDADRAAWTSYVDAQESASCYHQIGWKSVIEESFSVKTHYLMAYDGDGQVAGVLPMALLASVPFGRFLVSLPYFNYGGICASSEEASGALYQSAVAVAKAERAKHLELRDVAPSPDLPEKKSKVSMRLDLPATSDDLWKSLSSDLRRKVRRPQKEGIVARIERAEALNAFYDVFTVNMRDLGTPVYAKTFFANILREFPDSTWIATVYQGEQALASGFLVAFRDRIEIPWVSSLRAYNHLYTNMFLYWTVLSFACDKQYRTFDFGRSTVGGGTYKFKAQWGAQPLQLYWHYWVRNNGAVPELNPQNPKYAMAVRVWQKLPLTITNLLGPSIVRNLP
jgi:serine/alanine adding enzyme